MKFNKDFTFGTATSSYQIEGGYKEDGRTDSIWDVFSKTKGKIIDNSNGDIACDHYHRYEEDIKLMADLGVDSYRLSISWSRIIPKKGVINQKGIEFYRNIMNSLKQHGISVSVTIYHWDLPQWIYEENKGWVSRNIISYFIEYCAVLFREYDQLVDMWITLNEPWCSSFLSYLIGNHAPGHQSYEDYIRAHHHLLLAHGKAIKLYHEMNFNKPIGITLNPSHTYIPKHTFENELAKTLDDGFRNRLFYEPLFKGCYPMDVIALLSQYIKDFSFIQEGDLSIISEKCDFLGVNFYGHNYIQYNPNNPFLSEGADSDLKKTAMGWDVSPWALEDLIIRLRHEYTDIPIYITENGSAWDDQLIDGEINDIERIQYLEMHLKVVGRLNELGMNIKGYYAWSLIDNYEWAYGYTKRFGIVYVDYRTLERIPKNSYYYYQKIIKNREI